MVFHLTVIQTFGMMQEEVLAAVPLFIFMGYIVEGADLMARLFRAFRYLLAPLKGSLYLGVVFTATIFAMATGIVGAAVTVLGIMAAPIMMKCHYSPRLCRGRHCCRGHPGHPDPAQRDARRDGPGDERLGGQAVWCGVSVQAFSWHLCILLPARPLLLQSRVGAGGAGRGTVDLSAGHDQGVLVGMVPLAVLIAGTLGSILAGLATPTEAAAMGAFGGVLLAAGYGKTQRKDAG